MTSEGFAYICVANSLFENALVLPVEGVYLFMLYIYGDTAGNQSYTCVTLGDNMYHNKNPH